jgi:imidazolonepropionase
MLHVLKSIRHPVEVVRTYLGAHVLPAEYRSRRSTYVDLVISLLRDARRYAEYCDVCCDPVGFTTEECFRIGREALTLGLRLKVHADQTGPARGAELAARLGATSADHLDYISAGGIRAMAQRGTVGVLLPGVTYHMMEMTPRVQGGRLRPASKPFMPLVVHRMIEGGMRLALSADYNPGTSPTPSMQAVMQLAARLYRLSYAQIWLMSTINAAHALDRGQDRGSVEPGKRADLVLWRVGEHGMVINRFGINLADMVIKDGRVVVEGGIPTYASTTSSRVPPR